MCCGMDKIGTLTTNHLRLDQRLSLLGIAEDEARERLRA